MPIYEYKCNNCKKLFEVLVRGEEKTKCPDCGTAWVARKFSVYSFSSSSKFIGSSGPSCDSCSSNSCSGCGSIY